MPKPRKKPSAKAPNAKALEAESPGPASAPPGLTERQLLGIAALVAANCNVSRAAEQSGIPRRTLTEWRTGPLFRAALGAACGVAVTDSVRMTQAGNVAAVEALLARLADPKGAVVVAAAKAILEHAAAATLFAQIEELKQKVAALTEGNAKGYAR